MNWTIAENNWHQFKGRVRARWMRLDEQQLAVIAGKRPELIIEVLARSECNAPPRAYSTNLSSRDRIAFSCSDSGLAAIIPAQCGEARYHDN